MSAENPVSEIMSRPVERIAPDASITDAAATLSQAHVGSLILGEGILEGIVTETDIVRAVGEEVDLAGTPVSTIASDPVVTIRPHETVRTAGERMGHNGVKKLPVTEDGEPVGIVTTTDLAHFFPRSRLQTASSPQRDISEGEFE